MNHVHFLDPRHCLRRWLGTGTYFGLASYLPTRERGRHRKCFEVQVRDLNFLIFPLKLRGYPPTVQDGELLVENLLKNRGVGISVLQKIILSLLRDKFTPVLNTDASTVATGCPPCSKLIDVDVVDSTVAAELPKTTPEKPSEVRLFGRWLWSRLSIPQWLE